MKRGEGSIDWSTAQVEVGKRSPLNALSVEVEGDLGATWRQFFGQSLQTYNHDLERRAWGLVSVEGAGGTMSQTTIRVDEVQVGAEDDLRSQLDHLVKITNHRAVPAEENLSAIRAGKQKQSKSRADEAAQMEDRFRAA